MIINIKTIKDGIDFYWYKNISLKGVNEYIIGIRGTNFEARIPMWDVVRAEDSFRLRNGRSWNDSEALKWAIDYMERESEYIDFEEVPKEILFLTDGVSKNTGKTF